MINAMSRSAKQIFVICMLCSSQKDGGRMDVSCYLGGKITWGLGGLTAVK